MELQLELIILAFIGIFASILGTIVGGAGLVTLPAMMLFGIPVHTGIATNKFSTAIGSITSVFYLLRKGDITLREVSVYLISSLLGGLSGALITTRIPEDTMNGLALILLIFVFFLSLKNKNWTTTTSTSQVQKNWKTYTLPYFIGVYDGSFGPGATTFGIIHYLKQNLSYIKAVQYARALILGSSVGAFLVFVQTSYFDWRYAIAMAIGSMIGSQIGVYLLPCIPLRLAKFLLTSILLIIIAEVTMKIL